MLPQLTGIKGTILDLFFPKRCVGCGREGYYICFSCRRTIRRILPPICPRCGRPQPGGTLCPSCINQQIGVDGIRSPFRFEGVIREAIHQFKYSNLRDLSGFLAGMLYEYLLKYPMPGDVLVPVPLHPRRLRERGYNQSVLLAKELGRLTALPVIENCLWRTKYTSQQAISISVQDRYRNVAGVFDCRDNSIRDYNVVLVDDVATSGATINACARSLKAAGAASVWGLVVAREI
ncbi:MAG: ComF family protein [Dehalococcoidia bacterium]|nr:MAG: ComF family protein [Dehalococcoidia bacterium]